VQSLQSRRRFLTGLTALGTAAIAGTGNAYAAEGQPETTSVRFPVFAKVSDCQSPLYVAGDLLRAEGFTDIQFVASGTGPDSSDWIGHGEIDFDWNFPPAHVRNIDRGVPIKVLAGMHAGCLELIANDRVIGIPDLRGRKLGVDGLSGVSYLLLNIMATYVGLDPAKDFEWIETTDPVEMLAQGKIDAFLGGPPQPQQARKRKLGHVILSTASDKPWSQYYCCMLASTADYSARYPVATKRVLRALLKSVDLCVSDPAAVAKAAVEVGAASRYDFALQALRDARYDKWREYDPEDSLRFYALRMQETKAISMSPQDVIANGTDWRFVNELKRELKG
jgi:NitT/TauT family transport system substrate-binding protein